MESAGQALPLWAPRHDSEVSRGQLHRSVGSAAWILLQTGAERCLLPGCNQGPCGTRGPGSPQA